MFSTNLCGCDVNINRHKRFQKDGDWHTLCLIFQNLVNLLVQQE